MEEEEEVRARVSDLFMSWCSSLLLTLESGLARIPSLRFQSPLQSFDLSPLTFSGGFLPLPVHTSTKPGNLNCSHHRSCVSEIQGISSFPPLYGPKHEAPWET